MALPRRSNNNRMSSVLVPVGLGGSDADAVGLACELLGNKKGQLFIVYTIEVGRALPVDAEMPDDFARGEELLRRMEQVARPFGCRTQAEILQSRQAGLAAVQEAYDKQVDAIVLGMACQEPYGDYILDEAAKYILRNAPCSVILWREAAAVKAALTNGASPART